MEAIVLLGAPGAGKGTAARAVEAATSYRHLSTGDLFRRLMHEDSATGRALRPHMEQARMVPDDLVLMVMDAWLAAETSPDARILFDGFPRTRVQGKAFDALLEDRGSRLRAVFLLEAETRILVERMSRRIICPGCGTPYHPVSRPPRTPGRCDRCADPLLRRADDHEPSIQSRLQAYHDQTTPLVAYYRETGILRSIDAGVDAPAVVRQIVQGLNGTG